MNMNTCSHGIIRDEWYSSYRILAGSGYIRDSRCLILEQHQQHAALVRATYVLACAARHYPDANNFKAAAPHRKYLVGNSKAGALLEHVIRLIWAASNASSTLAADAISHLLHELSVARLYAVGVFFQLVHVLHLRLANDF